MFRRESADVRPYDATEEYHKIGFSASLVFSPARVDWSIDRALDALRRMRPLASPRDQGRILGAPPAPGADTLILVLFLFGLRHYSLERLRQTKKCLKVLIRISSIDCRKNHNVISFSIRSNRIYVHYDLITDTCRKS